MRHLLFDVAPHSIRAALVEDGELTEFQYEDRHHESLVGNIYVGRVQDMHRGISACFVDIGTGKNGYLPLPEGDKRPIGSTVVVQVLKDAAKEKGAVLTERLSIAGRFLVLLPGQGGQIAVSQKIIKPEERERIRTLLLPLLPEGDGVIVRTEGEGRQEEAFAAELKMLADWANAIGQGGKYQKPPALLYATGGLLLQAARDYLGRTVDDVMVNDQAAYEALQAAFPMERQKISYYESEVPLFDAYYIESQVEKLLQKKVWLKSGAFLVIEQTEACVVIDVNTGKFTGKKGFEKTVFQTNLEAAREVARQIRLRNLSGIILVDFIDMNQQEHRSALTAYLQQLVRQDHIKTTVVGMTELGLMQITRKKTRPPLALELSRPCRYCYGTGLLPSESYVLGEVCRQTARLFHATSFRHIEVASNESFLSYLRRSGALEEIAGRFGGKVTYRPIETGAAYYYECRGLAEEKSKATEK
ncbi:MAG TPA: Rne/Rng family ribonuclease [Firmicutes bacterium]|nr:Rne/Rng family ribonuclease [Bacillota bacterium]